MKATHDTIILIKTWGAMVNKPQQVTPDNWEELKKQGFTWQENIKQWSLYKVGVGEYLRKLREKMGTENAIAGVPANDQGVPDNSIEGADDAIGIYVRGSNDWFFGQKPLSSMPK